MVRRLVAVAFGLEMKEAGIVAGVRLLEELAKAGINAVAVDQGLQAAIIFQAAALADAQEDDAVNDALDGEIEFALGEPRVAQRQVAGQLGAPALDCLEEFVVNVGSTALGFGGLGEFVKGAFEDGVTGKDALNLIPALGVFGIGQVKDARDGGIVPVVGLDAAVVHGELLEIAEDAQWEFGGPSIAPKLVGRAGVMLDVHRRPFRFEEEFAGAADAEAVVRRLRGLAHFDGVLVNYVLVGLGVTLLVVNIPAKGLKERVEELPPDLGLVVMG